MKNGSALNQDEDWKTSGLWARLGVVADETEEGAEKATLASYLVDFVSFVRQVCFLDSQVSSRHIGKRGLGLGYE